MFVLAVIPFGLIGVIAFAQDAPHSAPTNYEAGPPAFQIALTEAGEPVIIPGDPITPPDASGQLAIFLAKLAIQYPWLALVITFIGGMRLWAKPTQLLIRKFVQSTPTPVDDQILEKVERSWWWEALGFVMDLIASIKLPAKKPDANTTQNTAALAVILCLGLAVGCKSNPETIAFKTISSLKETVKVTLAAWSDHVVATKKEIAKLPREERLEPSHELLVKEGRVAKALEEFKAAAASAEKSVAAAISGDAAPATAAMIAASAEFTRLVDELLLH
ncbi:MAG: hypothetical protein KIT22_14695 [Verrucomicrobiae bacterium]|nr:hypothetical protein [Verrucomicrobiae bacterium]